MDVEIAGRTGERVGNMDRNQIWNMIHAVLVRPYLLSRICPAKDRLFDMQFFLEILRQPMSDSVQRLEENKIIGELQ